MVLYICEKYLLDQADEITEQKIGEQVFRRPRGYNPGEDNIVRNYARLLRQRLEEYFAGEGAAETIRLVVPRGGYVPLFIEENSFVGDNKSDPTPAEDPPIDVTASVSEMPLKDPQPVASGRSPWALRTLCAVLFAALVLSLCTTSISKRNEPSPTASGASFSAQRKTLYSFPPIADL